MKFGKKLNDIIRPDWADEYVNYKRLKRILKSGTGEALVSSESPAEGGASAGAAGGADEVAEVHVDVNPLAAYAAAEGAFLAQALTEVHKVRRLASPPRAALRNSARSSVSRFFMREACSARPPAVLGLLAEL